MTEVQPEAVKLEFGEQTKTWLLSALSDGHTDRSTVDRAERMIAAYQANVQIQRESITRLMENDEHGADSEITKLAQELAIARMQRTDMLDLIRSATSGNVDPATAIATLRTAIKGIVN